MTLLHTLSAPIAFIQSLCFGLVLTLSLCSQASTPPTATQGVLDLRTYTFEERSSVDLQGEWGFWWDTLMPPTAVGVAPQTITVPGSWNGLSTPEGIEIGSKGKATYRLQILLDPARTPATLSLQLRTFREAYECYLNGERMAAQGRVSPTLKNIDVRPQLITFAPTDTVTLVFHVGNAHTFKGGLVEAIRLGSTPALSHDRSAKRARQTFLLGALLLIGLYHLILHLALSENQSALYFGITCMLLAIRTGTTGEHMLVEWLPWLPRWFSLRLEFGSLYLCPQIVGIFFKRTFPKEIPAWMLRFNFYITLALCLTLFLPWDWPLGAILPLSHLQLLVLGPLFLVLGLGRAVRRSRQGSLLFLVGFTALLVAAINDVLYARYLINTGFYVSYGLLVLVLCQATALAMRLAHAYRLTEELSHNLESAVEQRTLELAQKNQQLESRKPQVQQRQQMLQNSLQYARRIQESIQQEEERLAKLFTKGYIYHHYADTVGQAFHWFGYTSHYKVVVTAHTPQPDIPGAFVSIMGHTYLHQIIHTEAITDPAEILSRLHHALRKGLEANPDHVLQGTLSASIAVFDEATGLASFCSVGQSVAYLQRHTLLQVETSDIRLGTEEGESEAPLAPHSIPWESGDWCYLYIPATRAALVQEAPIMEEAMEKHLRMLGNLDVAEQKEYIRQQLAGHLGEDQLWVGFQV